MKTQRTLLLGMICLLIVLSLVVGCCAPQRKVLPDTDETPAGSGQAAPEGGTPDIMKTAQAEATRAAAAMPTQGAEMADGTPAVPSSTPTIPPTPSSPTAGPATAVPTVPAPAPTTPSTTGEVTYVVQRGDTLYSIARRYGTTVEAIATRNGIANPSLIRAGQTLIIPVSGTSPAPPSSGGTTYVVRPGDNLFRIALRYSMSYVDLARYNGISDPSRIYVGQVIRIPPR